MADRARSLLIKFLGDSKGMSSETDAVTGRLGKIKQSVSEADGFFGKLKAGGSGALDAIGGAGAVATAGITAVAGAAVKGVLEFKDLGVTIGQVSDATGLSKEAASRWVEVAGDAGIEAGALEGAIGKLNKNADPKVWDEYGAELVKAKDGTVDVSESMLSAVDAINAIEDPVKRNEAGVALLGKSWQSMSELIGRGSVQLRADLGAVSETKIFDEQKVEDARSLRDALDEIMDAGQDLFLTLGQALAPVISELAPMLADVVEAAKPLVEVMGKQLAALLKNLAPLIQGVAAALGPLIAGLTKVTEWSDSVRDAISGADHSMDEFGSVLGHVLSPAEKLAAAEKDLADRAEYAASRTAGLKTELHDAEFETSQAGRAMEIYEDAARNATIEIDAAKAATQALTDQYKELTGELSDEEAWLSLEDSVDSFKAKMADGTASVRDKQRALIDVKQDLIGYLTSLEGVPVEKQTEILALIDQGKIEEAERMLTELTRKREVQINAYYAGLAKINEFDTGPKNGGKGFNAGSGVTYTTSAAGAGFSGGGGDVGGGSSELARAIRDLTAATQELVSLTRQPGISDVTITRVMNGISGVQRGGT